MSSEEPNTSETERSDELGFDFFRAALYRNIHPDGVFGGITPKREIYMAMFIERPPMPSRIVHSIKDGRLGPEKREKRVASSDVERELEIGITMSPEVAQLVVRWLQNRIEQVKTMYTTSEETTEKRNP